jgi:PAS domain S-box-containing protein
MNSKDKTREKLIKELHDLQLEYNSLKGLHEKEITGLRLVEKTLAYEQYLMEVIMDSLPDHIYFKDRESHFIRINKDHAQSFGLSDPVQAVGKTDFDFFTEEHARQAYEDEQTVIQTGQPLSKEEKLTWPDRPDTWSSTTKLPMRDKEGNIIGTFGISKDITERKLAEEALRESEEHYRILFNEALDGICLADAATGLIIDCNQALSSLVGRGRAELIGQLQTILHPPNNNKAAYSPTFEQHLTDKEGKTLETQIITSTGIIREVEIKANQLDIHGRKTLQGVFRDITERKRAEEALAQEQHLMRMLMDNLPDHIYFKDHASRFIRINKSMAQFLGLNDPDQAVGKTDFDFFTGEHAQQAYEDEQTIIRTGQLLNIEEKETHHDRPDTWVSTIKLPMCDKEGNIIGTFGISRDITGRKQKELESQVLYEITQSVTSTDKLNELLKLIHQSLSKVLYADNCFVALYNESTGLFSFPYFVDKFDPIPLPASMKKSWTAYVFRKGKPVLFTEKLFNQLKEQNEVELVGSPSPSWIGIPLQTLSRTIGVLVLQHYEKKNVYSETDEKFLISIGNQVAISIERKKADEEIKLKNEQLQTSNAEKDKFFSILAHDLKGPLSAFLGATQILAEEIQSMTLDEIKEITVSMKESAINVYGLLENLLEWSGLKRGMMDFAPETFNVKQKITTSVEVLTESARKKKIKINYSLPEDLEIYADSHMFETVIRNLVSNAIKFTTKSGEISVLATATPDNNVEIKICDTGMGMNRELISKLFLINEKTSRKGTDGEPSSGLGLLLCKEFIEKLNGKIRVESEEGKGSTFSFTLPLKSK